MNRLSFHTDEEHSVEDSSAGAGYFDNEIQAVIKLYEQDIEAFPIQTQSDNP